MRIALGQINSTVGDFAGNRKKILEFTIRALDKGADLVVFPELALFGYSPVDLLEREAAVVAQLKEFSLLQKQMPSGIAILMGAVTRSDLKTGKPYRNSAAFLVRGAKPKIFSKELLPTYDVFDEARFIEPGSVEKGYFSYKGFKFLVTICEDIWAWDLPHYPSAYSYNPIKKLKRGSCDIVLNLSASPYTHGKIRARHQIVQANAKHLNAPVIYVNTVGAQDEIIFDGGSFVMDPKGKIQAQCLHFEEDINLYDVESAKGGTRDQSLSRIERTRQALVLGIRDFVEKNNLERVHLGLSGGIDSAVVACLAVDALGPARVTGLTLPGAYNAEESRDLAETLADRLAIRLFNLDIDPTYQAAVETLEAGLGAFPFGLVHENLQARIRGMLLMAFSNKENSMLLTTGNKSEYATGYSTLYGDMCGGLAPIADLVKSEVYELAELYNSEMEVIPKRIITRPPTAELRPNQKDEDSLPPYDVLDAAVRRLVEDRKPARNEVERWLAGTIAKNEFKRWQAPPILKVSKRSFGRGRRFPIANRFKF